MKKILAFICIALPLGYAANYFFSLCFESGITDMFSLLTNPNDTLSIVVGVMMMIIIVVAILLFSWLIFIAVDSIGLPNSKGKGVVVGKEFIPAHTSTTYQTVNNVSIPSTTHHPDMWWLTIKLKNDGRQNSMSVGEQVYDKIEKGNSVDVSYKIGRFSDDIYINSVST